MIVHSLPEGSRYFAPWARPSLSSTSNLSLVDSVFRAGVKVYCVNVAFNTLARRTFSYRRPLPPKSMAQRIDRLERLPQRVLSACRDREVQLALAAPLRRRFALPRFDEALLLQPVQARIDAARR